MNYTNFINDKLKEIQINIQTYNENIKYMLDDLKCNVDEYKILIKDNSNDPEYMNEIKQCKRHINNAEEQIVELKNVQEKLKRIESFLKTL